MLYSERRLYRAPRIISDTSCVVSVYGIGINGRLFSEGSSAGKLLVLEAYSIWNCCKYAIVLNLMQIRQLFSHRPDLLRPGRKKDLLKEIVGLLYFEYTISIAPYEDDDSLNLSKGNALLHPHFITCAHVGLLLKVCCKR